VAGTLAAMFGALSFLLRPTRPPRAGVGVGSRGRRSAVAPAPVFEAAAPTLFYVVTRRHAEVMAPYVMGWGPAPERRMAFLFYEELPQVTSLPSGTYVFADLERLRPRQLELASRVSEQLAKEPEQASVLNDPRRALRRHDLLARLHAAGVNRFRVVRACDPWPELRFPVFLHEERSHDGALTPLLHDERALHRALRRARLLGLRRRDLLVTEFCDTSDADGLFRKYSAFRVGDEILPRHVLFSRGWHLKRPDLESEAFEHERRRYLDDNPHETQLREIFELAGIGFGRIDYSLLDGEIQVWEINTNPTVSRRTQSLTRAFEAIDRLAARRSPLPIHLAPDLVAAAEREQRVADRLDGLRRIGRKLAVSVPGQRGGAGYAS